MTRRASITPLHWIALLVTLFLPLSASGQGIAQRPQFAPGMVLRYQFDLRTTTHREATGVVADPQAGAELTVRFAAVLKLEALVPAAAAPTQSQPQAPHDMRATIEQVSVVIGGDTFDPSIAPLQQRYQRLEGFSMIFSASDQAQPPHSPRSSHADLGQAQVEAIAESWLRALAFGMAAPPGTTAGKSWSNEQPIPAAPLKGTVLRTKSTYLRDEPCGGQGQRAAASVPSLAAESCAVILATTTLAQSGSRSDQSPDTYRARDLRTAGRWEGAGESLAYISLRAGWIISVTETQSEQIDFTVSRTPSNEIVIRHLARTATQTNLLLQSVELKN